MRRTVAVALAVALMHLVPALAGSAAARGKAVARADLIGSWKPGGLDCESITLEADGTFSSYLHDRPFDQGRWQLEGTTLVLKGNAGEDRVTDLKRQGKKLTGKVGGTRVTWTRI